MVPLSGQFNLVGCGPFNTVFLTYNHVAVVSHPQAAKHTGADQLSKQETTVSVAQMLIFHCAAEINKPRNAT